MHAGGHIRAEFQRARWRLENARDEIATCAISGAVGTFVAAEPVAESRALIKSVET